MNVIFKIILLYVLLFALGCTKHVNDTVLPVDTSFTKLEARLWFEKNSDIQRQGRTSGSPFDSYYPIWENALEGSTVTGEKYIEVPLKSKKQFKIILDNKEDLLEINFSLVIYKSGEMVSEAIKEIVPDMEYLKREKKRIRKGNFDGKIFTWGWDGKMIGGSFYKKGKREGTIRPIHNLDNVRTSTLICNVYTTCAWTSYCTGHLGSAIIVGTTTHSSNSYCTYPMDAHGTIDSYYCSNWEMVDSYSYQQCIDIGGNPDPGEGSGPGEVDTFQGFPQNPTSNQKFTYTNPSGVRTTFTYNSEFKLWMLPEVTYLLARGGQINLNVPLPPSYNGKVLAAIAAVAIPEPTPVGEIVLAGAAVVVTGMYIYDQIVFTSYLNTHPHLGECINNYVRCRDEWAFTTPCDDCLHRCRMQGAWDYSLCPN